MSRPRQVYDEFITARYGRAALPHVKAAFKNAFDIVTSSLYTLGTNTANHSKLDYDPYASSYSRSVSGKWIDPPFVDGSPRRESQVPLLDRRREPPRAGVGQSAEGHAADRDPRSNRAWLADARAT